jgi:hypothetical protein
MSDESDMNMDGQSHEITMTNAATTIDPTVVQSRILQSSSLAAAAAAGRDNDSDDDDEMGGEGGNVEQPTFAKLNAMADRGGKSEYRRVRCPKHRYTPLREDWEQILMPLVQFLKLQVCSMYHLYHSNGRIWPIFVSMIHVLFNVFCRCCNHSYFICFYLISTPIQI